MTAALFDLDGLLVDSEGIHFEAYKAILGEYGIELTQQMFIESWLAGKRYGTRAYLQQVGREEAFDEAREKKATLYRTLVRGRLQLMPGARELLEALREAGILCGLGTGAYKDEYEFAVDECGLRKFMQAMTGGDEVEHNKPSPDVYLASARKMRVKPETCVVFENSEIGMEAALSAGMKCFAIPSEWTDDQTFRGATRKFSSLTEVKIDDILKACATS